MKISLCIPQYNRIQYLLKNLSFIAQQSYADIEVVIADDASTDNTEEEIRKLIPSYKYPLVYYRHPANAGYDANLRKSLELASGDYCVTLGNDDTLRLDDGIAELVIFLEKNNRPELGFCNYAEDGQPIVPVVRAHQTQVLGSGQDIALKYYRSFSFVGGLVIRKDIFNAVNTSKADGSVFVQMYFASLIVTKGGRLFMYEPCLVLKDIQIGGSMANSYRDTLMRKWSELKPIDGGLKQVIWAVLEGFKDAGSDLGKITYRVLKNIYMFTYPFWLIDYRSNGSLVGAAAMMKGLRPSGVPQLKNLSVIQRIKIKGYYFTSTAIGFLLPVFIFQKLKMRVYKLIKK